MRGLPDEGTRDGVSPLADLDRLVVEGRYGRADVALRRIEALIPSLAQSADAQSLLLALYGRAVLLRQLGAGSQSAIGACDVLERAAQEREESLWAATACALRARFRVDAGDIGGATADLARADAELATDDLSSDTGYRLLDGVALVYAGLRLNDRADEVRARIESAIGSRRVLEQAQHWAGWAGELASRAMEPLAGGAPEPQHELMARAVQIAAKLDDLPEAEVPATLRRGARGVRALSAAYRGRPSEALRLLGPDAFGTVGDLPTVERQIVSLAAMRAHALVGSLATARSLDDAAATPPATLANLVLEVCRTRERLWLETYASGDVIPVLHRMTELLVRLGWRGMDLVADTARQALEHQALRTESRTDALTGVGNRRALDEELRQLLRFGPLPLALILVDIDHFKEVNDRFTHVVGDEVLRRVAASLSLQLRTNDQLLRYGGDEFVVLLPGTGDEEANAVAERMVAAVAARPWNELADGLSATVTTGVAAVWSLSGRRPDADAEKLFRRADERLLDAKRRRPEEAGRDRGRGGPTLLSPPIPPVESLPLAASAPLTASAPPIEPPVDEHVTAAQAGSTPVAAVRSQAPVDEVPAPLPTRERGGGRPSTIDLRSGADGVYRTPSELDRPAPDPDESHAPGRSRRGGRRPPSPFDPPPTGAMDLSLSAVSPPTGGPAAAALAPVEPVTPVALALPEPVLPPLRSTSAAGHSGDPARTRRQALDASGAMKLFARSSTPMPQPPSGPATAQPPADHGAAPIRPAAHDVQAPGAHPAAWAGAEPAPPAAGRRDLDPPSAYRPGGYEPPRYGSTLPPSHPYQPEPHPHPYQADQQPYQPEPQPHLFQPEPHPYDPHPYQAEPHQPEPPQVPERPHPATGYTAHQYHLEQQPAQHQPAPYEAVAYPPLPYPAQPPHPAQPNGPVGATIPATTSPSGWPDPAGPVTTRQAIIDLSARKRPRPRS